MTRGFLVAALCSTLAWACSSGSSRKSSSSCEQPGLKAECTCSDDSVSQKECLDTGKYGDCQCTASPGGTGGTTGGTTGGETGGATGGETGGTTGGETGGTTGGETGGTTGGETGGTTGGETGGTTGGETGGTTGGETGGSCEAGSMVDGLCCTCTPAGCEAGIDNALAGLAGLTNTSLQESLDAGSLHLLVVLDYAGDAAIVPGVQVGAACDYATEECDWRVEAGDPENDCMPTGLLEDVVIDGDTVTAGPGIFGLSLALQGIELALQVKQARFEGELDSGGAPFGVLAGAIAKADLAAAIDALDPEALPIPKESIKSILENVVKSDIDADGDGTPESASVGIVIETIPGEIAVVSGDCPSPLDELPVVYRITSLQLGTGGEVGQGLDVDGICE